MKTKPWKNGYLYLIASLLISFGRAADAPHHPTRIILKPKNSTLVAPFHAIKGCLIHREYPLLGGLQVVTAPLGQNLQQVVAQYQASGLVEFAELDYIGHASQVIPNDSLFADQYYLQNTGQTTGSTGADIDAPNAWDWRTSANEVVVAVLDSGVRATHEEHFPLP